jgi:hypothetical protein
VTTYEVFAELRRGEEEPTWLWAATVDARSAHAAIRSYLGEDDPSVTAHHYVAVPTRSWRPVSVTVQTETKIKIG